MLRKLLKHEFRATGRIMLPLFGILLLVSVGANFSSRGMLNSDSSLLRTLGTIFIMLFIVGIFAVGIISFVLMISRFYKNLLQDEGYVMMTLPVCVHQQIWSKLIVSTVWFAATVVVIGLSCCIMAFDIRFVGDLWHGFLNLLDYAVRINHLDLVANGAAFAVELLLLCVLGSFGLCLRFYSAMSIGFSFPNHKGLLSVTFYNCSPDSGRPRHGTGERFLVPPASAGLGAQRFRCGRYASGYVVPDRSGTYLLCRFLFLNGLLLAKTPESGVNYDSRCSGGHTPGQFLCKGDLMAFWETVLGKYIMTMAIAAVPVVELRGAIPAGIAAGLDPWLACGAAIFGNLLPVPFIILLVRQVFDRLRKHAFFAPKIDALERRAHLKGRLVRKYRLLGLMLFVAIPLPGTGAWTGALIAAFLNIRLRHALPAITLGLLIAGSLVTLMTLGLIHLL